MKTKQSEELLIIFTRNPELGKVKTRLAKDIGDEAALALYRFLLEHTVSVTASLKVDKQVFYSEKIQEDDIWNSAIFSKRLQQGLDLGQKMENAFREAFSENYKSVVIIGSDLYDLETKDLENAFFQLKTHDAVIGPAKDGGYYLLGMKSLNSSVFKNKKWSTNTVFKETLKDLKNKNVNNLGGSPRGIEGKHIWISGQAPEHLNLDCRIKILETRNDIDEVADIKEHPELLKFIK